MMLNDSQRVGVLTRLAGIGLLAAITASCAGQAGTTPSTTALTRPSESLPISGATAAAGVQSGGASIKIAYPSQSAVVLPLWVAADQGLFRKYGINVELLNAPPPNDTQALLGGDVQFDDDGAQAINARLAGSDVEYVAIDAPYFVFSLYGSSQIRSVKDLVGKTVAVTSPGASTDYALRTLLKHESISESQVTVTYARTVAGVTAAIQAGDAQAGVLSAPATVLARQAGLHEIINIADLKLPTVHQGMQVRQGWAKQHRENVTAVLKGYMEAIKVVKQSKGVAEAVLGKYAKISDQAQLEEAYVTVRDVFPAVPLASEASILNLLQFAKDPKAVAHQPAEFYDNSYLQSLQTDFVKSLYPEGIPA